MKCKVCGGTGYIKASEDNPDAIIVNNRCYEICKDCKGTGSDKKKIQVLELHISKVKKNLLDLGA